MCYSATASFTAAAALVPAGAFAVRRAARSAPQYLALAALPILFGAQQFSEGIIWVAGAQGNQVLVDSFSRAYMFFTWLAWPVWIPVSIYFLEPGGRKPLYLAFAVLGGMLGAVLYVPYFAHDGWLVTTFLKHAIRYDVTELLDVLIPPDATNLIYLAIVIAPLLIASNKDVNVFGLLVIIALGVTYFAFSFAYISVFCFGAGVLSLYLAYVISTRGAAAPMVRCDGRNS